MVSLAGIQLASEAIFLFMQKTVRRMDARCQAAESSFCDEAKLILVRREAVDTDAQLLISMLVNCAVVR
jgi:hypothetical protein